MTSLIVVFLGLTLIAQGQRVITTVAGTDYVFPPGAQAGSSVVFRSPQGVAADAVGNCYVADQATQLVVRVTPTGTASVVAGNGFFYHSGNGGQATNAGLVDPIATSFDPAGNLYIAESGGFIRRVDKDGIVTTIAGKAFSMTNSGDGGPALNAGLSPVDVVADKAGNIYIAEMVSNRVRRVDTSGIITTYAGTGNPGYSSTPGPATSADLSVNAIAMDAQQNLYIADSTHHVIRVVNPQGIISTFAGGGESMAITPKRIAVGSNGTVYFAEDYDILQVSGGVISRVFALSGSSNATLFNGIAVRGDGSLCVTDSSLEVALISQGTMKVIAGGSAAGILGDGGPALAAYVDSPSSVGLDGQGGYYIADSIHNVVRYVSPQGFIKTVAGTGVAGYSGDGGDAAKAQISGPVSVAVDSHGDLFIAEGARIRRVSNGIITTYIGGPGAVNKADSAPITAAAVSYPSALAFSPSGQLYFADRFFNAIRRVNGANLEYFRKLSSSPMSLAFDPAGNLYYSLDAGNFTVTISRVSPAGVTTLMAGNGQFGYTPDGMSAVSQPLETIYGITVDRNGTLYFTEYYTGRVRSVGADGILRTAAGSFDFAETFDGDGGDATSAHLNRIFDVQADASGNLFIADTGNHRIREVLASPPALNIDTTSLSFSAASGGAPTALQQINFTGSIPGVPFTITISPASAAQWLIPSYTSAATPLILAVQANPLTLMPGTYNATIQIAAPLALPATQSISVTFNVAQGQPPSLQTDKTSLSFTFPQRGTARGQLIQVINAGGGTLPFMAAVSTQSGGSGLSVSPASGSATPGSPALLTVTADPSSLQPGTYQGTLTVTSGSQSKTLLITVSVSTRDQAMLLGQAGISFLAVAGGGVVPPQSFGVYNIGTGIMPWTVSTLTLSGGPNWLIVSPSQGSSDASSSVVPRVTVSVNPAGLAPGRYYGLIRVVSAAAANSPQLATALLEVLPAGQDPGAVVQPQELTFYYPTLDDPPGSQVVSIYNLTATNSNFVAKGVFSQTNQLNLAPYSSSVSPQVPSRLVVQPNLIFAPSTILTLQFDDGVLREIPVKFIYGSSGASSSSAHGSHSASVCAPQKLVPSLSATGQLATHVNAGWPTALSVLIQDDCGAPSVAGTVVVSFSNGDSPISLQSQQDGNWEGTWQNSSTASTQVTLTIEASDPARGLSGTAQAAAGVVGSQDPPVFIKDAVVSNADPVSNVPIGLGSIVSIYGTLLADSTATFSAAPLPITLGNTQVLIGGELAPLYYASPGLLNVQVPYDLQPDTTHQIVVSRGSTYSVPVAISVAQAQPAAFLYPAAGANAAIAVVFRTQNGATQSFLATPSNPAQAGDEIVLYCTGLGAAGTVSAGQAASLSSLISTQNAVSLSIGGIATTPDFAGLAPGYVGLYQVNARIPSGITSGPAVPITLRVLNLISPTVSIALQ